jgi:hypothetical protein
MTTAQTTALENSAPICSRHALAKPVDAHAAADLRLIRTFGHSSFLTLKIIAQTSVGRVFNPPILQIVTLSREGGIFDKLQVFQDRQVIIP